MQSVMFTIVVVGVWLSALFNGTGLGHVYQTNQLTITVMAACALLLWVRRRQTTVPVDLFCAFGGMTAIFVGSSLFHGRGLSGLEYLSCFLLVYCFSQVRIRTQWMHLAGLASLGLGAVILVIFNFSTQLSGWNDNSIAMIGLFSYILFVAAFYNLRSRRAKALILLAGAGMFWLIAPTDSRSCLVMLVVTMALALLMRPSPRALRSRGWVVCLLLIPLGVALVTVALSASGSASELDAWSQQTFAKSIFNGRDRLWLSGLQQLGQRPLFGSGNIAADSWHNTAVACLTSFGVLGYAFWLYSLYALLKRGSAYLADPVVTGCMTAFLLMNAQQAVELGMFAQNPNLLIYLPLGLMLGRVRYLKGSAQ